MPQGDVRIMLRVGDMHYDCGRCAIGVPPTFGEIVHLYFPVANVKLCGQVGWVYHMAVSLESERGGDPHYQQELYPTIEVVLSESQSQTFAEYWKEYTRRKSASTELSRPVGATRGAESANT